MLYGSFEPGDTLYTNHPLLPRLMEGPGIGNLAPLYVVSVTDQIQPPRISLKCLDLRLAYCTWWSPLKTDIGLTDDLTGIAILDQAGGWKTDRAQVAFGERPGNDATFQQISANRPVVDAFGLLLQGGGDTNHLLNSSFSEGVGDSFTSWTSNTSGAAIAVRWNLYTLIDATGYRSSCQIATYASGENAYLSQTVAAMDDKKLYVRVYYKNGGAYDDLTLRVQRSVDGLYWRDSDRTWQGSPVDNVISPKSGVVGSKRWVSKQIDLTGLSTSLTVSLGHFNCASAIAQITQLQGCELLEMTADTTSACRWRSPLPTKDVAIQRLPSLSWIVNDSAVRVLSPTRGFVKFSAQLHWDHFDLTNGERKYLWAADFDGLSDANYFRFYYRYTSSTEGAWYFIARSGLWWQEPSYIAVLPTSAAAGTLPTVEQKYEFICRWTSVDADELGLPGQYLDLWVDGVKGTGFGGIPEQSANSQCNVYLGISSAHLSTPVAWSDMHVTDLTISDHCPTDEELLRY